MNSEPGDDSLRFAPQQPRTVVPGSGVHYKDCTVTQKTWGGRFEGGTDRRVEEFTESISFDRRLYRHDVRASQAHARMLAEAGLLTHAEADEIAAALNEIAAEIESGKFEFSVSQEDIHTHIEQ